MSPEVTSRAFSPRGERERYVSPDAGNSGEGSTGAAAALRFRSTGRPGTPNTVEWGGTSRTTTVLAPITLSWLTPPVSVKFTQELLEESLGARLVSPDTDEVELFFDPDPLITYLLGIQDEIEQPPVDAQIVARHDEQITIIPGRSELLIDERGVSAAVLQAARSATNSSMAAANAATSSGGTTRPAPAASLATCASPPATARMVGQ